MCAIPDAGENGGCLVSGKDTPFLMKGRGHMQCSKGVCVVIGAGGLCSQVEQTSGIFAVRCSTYGDSIRQEKALKGPLFRRARSL